MKCENIKCNNDAIKKFGNDVTGETMLCLDCYDYVNGR